MSTRTRVGCDLASTAEVRESVATFGQRYLRRVYTDAELVACDGRPERLAARFAAKEACAKVLGDLSGALPWLDVEVTHDAGGRPVIATHRRAAALAGAAGVLEMDVSLSHQGDLAMAVVVAAMSGPAAVAGPDEESKT